MSKREENSKNRKRSSKRNQSDEPLMVKPVLLRHDTIKRNGLPITDSNSPFTMIVRFCWKA
jgi:hypothetical protein